MSRETFPMIALVVGAVLLAVLMAAGAGEGGFTLPLLTMLLISEFGFLVTGAGAFLGAREWFGNGFRTGGSLATIACVVLAVVFAIEGFAIWEHVGAMRQ
ncbi:MAG: hypothetical protein U9R74_12080 [Pseudomonadota bacterium]|nr:hypothetical protein [Pseudomonadota bacterium]